MPSGKGHGNLMTPSAASNIQSSQAKAGRDMSSGGFAARAQAAGAHNVNSGYVGGTGTGQASQGGNQPSGQGKK
ncbi:hypothetical protein F4859DRAFT_516968 [Xylaria cf. heliscus]|nr:hypothetical protein F4859DRAFT_516968 [Xylaria cf. heliscus]